jgi:hypothetical protein
MSPRAARRVLWLAALLLVPVPLLVFDACAPVASYLLLAAVCVGMRVAEGPGGVVWQLTALFLAHAVVYAGLLHLAASLAARATAPLPAAARAAVVVVAVAAGVGFALIGEPYVTPFGTAARANLLGTLR